MAKAKRDYRAQRQEKTRGDRRIEAGASQEENVTVVVNGDVSQKDIRGPDGLSKALNLFAGKEGFGSVEFNSAKVERSAIAQAIVTTYEQDEANSNAEDD